MATKFGVETVFSHEAQRAFVSLRTFLLDDPSESADLTIHSGFTLARRQTRSRNGPDHSKVAQLGTKTKDYNSCYFDIYDGDLDSRRIC